MKKNSLIITIIIAIVVGGLAFWGGIQYQKSRFSSSFGSGGRPVVGLNRLSGNQDESNSSRAFLPVSGKVISVEEETITIETQDVGTKIVALSDSTQISKTIQGSLADLKAGEQIMVVGLEDASGVIVAQNVSVGENRAFLGRPENSESGSLD